MRSLHDAFRADVQQAVNWYESEQPGIGELFAEELDAALFRIEQRPTAFPIFIKRRRIRRALLHRFPFAIYYRPSRGVEYVLGISHLARAQRSIQRQLAARDHRA